LTQTGGVPTALAEGNFDTSDQVINTGATGVGQCGPAAPCTVTIAINGTQVYQSAAGDPLDFGNKDDGGVVTAEASNWVQVATPTGYTLKLGYADNSHNNSIGCATPCFPSPWQGGVTQFIGNGLPVGNGGECSSNCYDAGALLITAVQVTPPFTGCTVTQGGWGAKPHGNNPAAFLAAHFPGGGVIIGSAPNLLTFSSAAAVGNFLPQGGPPGTLTASATDPTGSTAGVFAGQVLALSLNVQLKQFGTAVLTGTGTSLDGKTVTQILAAANLALSGGALPSGFTISSLNNLVDLLNNSFDGCVATTWGTAHLH